MTQPRQFIPGTIRLRRAAVCGLVIWGLVVVIFSGQSPPFGEKLIQHPAVPRPAEAVTPVTANVQNGSPRLPDETAKRQGTLTVSTIGYDGEETIPVEEDAAYPPVDTTGPPTSGWDSGLVEIPSHAPRNDSSEAPHSTPAGTMEPSSSGVQIPDVVSGHSVSPGELFVPVDPREERADVNSGPDRHGRDAGSGAMPTLGDSTIGELVPGHATPGTGRDGSSVRALSSVTCLWWEDLLPGNMLPGREGYRLSLQQALGLALTEAPELQVLQSDWYIRRMEQARAAAAFDWVTFVDAIWNRDSTPVGSDLDGATDRLRSRSVKSSAGVRRLTRDGSEIELSQDFGTLGSNSQFINPNNQGTSRLSLDYERPLLQGAGEDINTSALQLAGVDKEIAFDRFQAGVQDHLLQVSTAYWTLVLRRGRFVQVVRSWQRAKAIAEEMELRISIDVTPGMLHRARSEVAQRLSDAIDAEHEVLRAQDGLLRLIYGSRFTDFADCEVLTTSLPMRLSEEVPPGPQVARAIRMRSEIHQTVREIKGASIRHNVASNQLLPVLNMVLTGYVAGLRGNNDIGGAFLKQFSEGEPGVGIGFNFEIPYRNRAARAAAEQAQAAIRRMQSQLQATIGVVAEDVRNQVIQRNKFGAVLAPQKESLDRALKILEFTKQRREMLADGNNVADLYLENLLQMQSRLENAEEEYLRSQIRYSLADNALLRAVAALDSIAEHNFSGFPPCQSEYSPEFVSAGHDFSEAD